MVIGPQKLKESRKPRTVDWKTVGGTVDSYLEKFYQGFYREGNSVYVPLGAVDSWVGKKPNGELIKSLYKGAGWSIAEIVPDRKGSLYLHLE